MLAVGLLVALAVAPANEPPKVPRPTLGPRWRPRGAPKTPENVSDRAKALGLRRRGSGFQRIREPGDRFEALIRADGRVVFTLDPEVVVRVDGVCAAAVCVGGKPAKRRKVTGHGAALIAGLVTEAVLTGRMGVGPWGYGTPRQGPLPRSTPEDPPPIPIGHVVGRYGHLPAPASEMSAFMDETLAFRTELAEAHAIETLQTAYRDLVIDLRRLWSSGRTAAEQRAWILERWAGLDDGTSTPDAPLSEGADLDALRSATADKARALIEASVRTHLPAGSDAAFDDAELEAFNAGARVPFWPYGRPEHVEPR